ncbi:mitochondrial ribosomal protein S23 (mS23) [Andalucia godoyi]|uniref:Small ribosomal subunit protein mS23 n=1 Tax=Andalucia godoyi TaxID=505711 RepID=A0A8K0AH90_ANDGO|nr:mitochondrial ribosomal protein S23 (mS23) [Andalucia godoyi]|eukprot:ANDGO_07482.mRNA.1 mitochondrial ribosomal protein S23 (mS23)
MVVLDSVLLFFPLCTAFLCVWFLGFFLLLFVNVHILCGRNKRIIIMASTFLKVRHLLKSRTIAKPSWFDAVSTVPPPIVVRENRGKPQRIEFPEDRLLAKYYSRNPRAKLEALRLYGGGFHESTAFQFVKRQSELIRSGLSEEDAYNQVNVETNEARRKREFEADLATRQAVEMGARPPVSLLEIVQAEEERYIQMMRDKKAPARQQAMPAASGMPAVNTSIDFEEDGAVDNAAEGEDQAGAKRQAKSATSVRSARRK